LGTRSIVRPGLSSQVLFLKHRVFPAKQVGFEKGYLPSGGYCGGATWSGLDEVWVGSCAGGLHWLRQWGDDRFGPGRRGKLLTEILFGCL
jgi:hypothetical protein